MAPLFSTTLLRAQSDRRLIQMVHAGHEPAFAAIVERYRPQLHRYCLRILPEGRCEDALQQAFLQAWRALRDGKTVHQLRPWLYAIVHNAAVSQLRQGVFDYAELLDTVQGSADPEADVERRSIMRQTLAAVAALPERQRAALLAVVVEGRPQSQVALEMGLTENGLRQLLFRARTSLRSAATALTPTPLLVWAMRAATTPFGGRAGEVAAGSAAVAGGVHALQGGTALVVVGSLAIGGTAALGGPQTHRPATPGPAVAVVRGAPEAAPVPLPAVRHAGTRRHRASAVSTTRPARLRRTAPAVRHLAVLVDRRVELAPAREAPAAASAPAAPPAAEPPAQIATLAPAPAETVTPDAAPPTAESSTASPAPAPALGPESGEGSSGSGDQPPPGDGRVDNSGPGNQTDGAEGDSAESGGGPGPSDGGGSGDGSSESHHGQG
ncbi:MAG TPA: sigma-70 family RNA polymerase sigma factor [Solirubrobacteraceae bacterium]